MAYGAGALGAGFLAAGPAVAAPAAPPPCGLLNACPPNPGVVSGSPGSAGGTITVTWKSPAGMFPDTASTAPLTITWTPVGTAPPLAPSPPVTVFTESGVCASPANSPDLTCTYAWPGALMVNKFVLNGTYSLSAAADDCALPIGPCSKPQAIDPNFQSLAVANPPAAPTKVTAALVQNSSAVKISWAANPEPDIVGYQVVRADNSVACQVPLAAANPTTYSCVDAPTKDGKYAYTVVAYRWGATYSTALKDEQASPHSTATAALTVVGASANTTTTVAAGTAGTLGPAGFVPRLTPTNSGGGGAAFAPKLSPAVTTPAAPVDTPANGDTGFLPSLPYGQRAAPPTTADPAVIPVPAAPHKAKSTSVGSIAVVGAGLLLAVIALHGLWLRSEVRRSGALEVLEPGA